jgi:hypothetical protein
VPPEFWVVVTPAERSTASGTTYLNAQDKKLRTVAGALKTLSGAGPVLPVVRQALKVP